MEDLGKCIRDCYNVHEITSSNDQDWNYLCANSKQYTPYVRDDYLAAVDFIGKKYIVYRKETPFMGICIPLKKDCFSTSYSVPFSPHHGLLYSTGNSELEYQKKQEATAVLLGYLENIYSKISFSNHYTVQDMRPMLWHNYHDRTASHYKIDIAYTSVKYIKDDVFINMRSTRKYEYKYAKNKYGLKCVDGSCDIYSFMNLYQKTFLRQEINLDKSTLCMVENIVRTALNNRYGFMRYAIDINGDVISAVFILYHDDTAYYIFGANDPAQRKKGGGTFLLVNAMEEAKKMGLTYFDFVGVNSPMRGSYKLSFGGELKPYYICSLPG